MFNFDLHPLATWRISLRAEVLQLFAPVLLLLLLSATYYAWAHRRSAHGCWRRVRESILPARIFNHPSARIDALMLSLSVVLWQPLISVAMSIFVGVNVGELLDSQFGENAPILHSPALIFAAEGLVSLLSVQFAFYAMHRLCHANPLMWRIHRVHHSAEALNFMTASRTHPLEILLFQMPTAILSGSALGLFLHLAGTPISPALPVAQTILVLVRGVVNLIHHSHFDLSFGIFDYIFVSARTHRIHHSIEAEHCDKNFGGVLAIYDWMFGTLYIPKPREVFRVGLDDHHLGINNPHQRLRDCYLDPLLYVRDGIMARLRTRKTATPVE